MSVLYPVASKVTRSQTKRTHLSCGGMGDLHHSCPRQQLTNHHQLQAVPNQEVSALLLLLLRGSDQMISRVRYHRHEDYHHYCPH